MDFQHSGEIWRDFPELVPGIVLADGITDDVAAGDRVAKLTAIAKSRLTGATESERPEIQAWRRAFARMGLKPTQYRCASEALLRRLRKEGTLPQLHPLIDAGHRDPAGRQRRPLPGPVLLRAAAVRRPDRRPGSHRDQPDGPSLRGQRRASHATHLTRPGDTAAGLHVYDQGPAHTQNAQFGAALLTMQGIKLPPR